MKTAISWYDEHAKELAVQYEALSPESVHGWAADLLPQGNALALYVGAGTGRDAAWLTSRGYEVVAVEPSAGMREEAQRLHADDPIQWVNDSLPDFKNVFRLGLTFDFILLSAVWMHISEVDRPRAFRKLITLLKPGGVIAMSLRQGPVDVDRDMHPVSEQEIERLRDISTQEWALWAIDQHANDIGMCVDAKLIESAIRIDDIHTRTLLAEAEQITGLENPNSVAQLKLWLQEHHGEDVESLNKDALKCLTGKLNGSAKRMMEIRQQLGKTSVDKYRAMGRSTCRDGRVRGLLQFYGAARTGRWAGRLIQVQNLPRPGIEEFGSLDAARDAAKLGDAGLLQAIYGNPAQVLSDLIRTALIASEGHRLIVCDESAIEARVLAWLANELWRLEVFRTHGRIYEASASQMFKVPLEKITKGNPEYALRQKGKVAELALGYQGGPGALIAMGALTMGILEDELPTLVGAWRGANKSIVKFWAQVEADAKRVVREKIAVHRDHYGFSMDGKSLLLHLPSGRALFYREARIEEMQLRFDGQDQKTKKWTRIDTYGGRLVENMCQAVARDCMAEAMLRLRDAGYQTRMTVHDEIIAEMPLGVGSVQEVETLMGAAISWADGLPLKGNGFETTYYRKD